MDRTKVVIMGAAGRDFHDFNVVYRDDPSVEVVAITATQIPGIEKRHYPPELAGPLYPAGIPIVPEDELDRLFAEQTIDRVVFAYSDVTHEHVMHQASRALAGGERARGEMHDLAVGDVAVGEHDAVGAALADQRLGL